MKKLSVKTLDQAALATAAQDLARLTLASGQPDLVIGIRTGGFLVAELAMPALPKSALLLPITCRRPSTAHKEKSGALKQILKRLPRQLNNVLRILEHLWLNERRAPQPKRDFIPDAAELTAIQNLLPSLGSTPHLLLIDDAIDSGATMLAVAELLQTILPTGGRLTTASLTLTTSHPLILPDYRLYSHVLCRFPWSFDF
jgi:hypoxanthine phosphoribosyltransferase